MGRRRWLLKPKFHAARLNEACNVLIIQLQHDCKLLSQTAFTDDPNFAEAWDEQLARTLKWSHFGFAYMGRYGFHF